MYLPEFTAMTFNLFNTFSLRTNTSLRSRVGTNDVLSAFTTALGMNSVG